MPATAIDNLLSFGYMVPGVVNVGIEIDQEKKIVDYKITVDSSSYRKYQIVNSLSRGGIIKKIIALILINTFKAPKPFIYRDFVIYNATQYLPPNYQVNVNVGK